MRYRPKCDRRFVCFASACKDTSKQTQSILGSFYRFRDLARARVAILSINATPQLLLSFVSGISVLLGSLNPDSLLHPTAVALRYYRACTAALTRRRAVAQNSRALPQSLNYGGRLSAAGAAASHGDEDHIPGAARAAAGHQERLAREAHEWPTRATQATRRDGRR